MNVLIIEDDPLHLKLAHEVLKASGFSVHGIEEAEKAWEAIKVQKPNLILLDLELKGMKGLDLAKLLKTNPKTRKIHIVAVTSYAERYTQQEALAAGCEMYLTKPLNVRALPGQLENLIK